MSYKVKRSTKTKDLNTIRSEYKERRKKRSEKNVEKILSSMKKAQDPNYQSDTENISEENCLHNGNSSSPKTLSIAVPASILDNAQSAELRTYLAGQVARAACIFKVDEVIIFNDVKADHNQSSSYNPTQSCFQFARILQFLECPQYLRKTLFPLEPCLQYAGLLNPLDAPHHLRQNDESTYREGVVSKCPPKPKVGSYVAVGLTKDVLADKILEPNLRVTVKLTSDENTSKLRAQIVSPSTPKTEAGLYWGYCVRIATSLKEVFSECPYDGAYDCTIGTSDKGDTMNVIDLEYVAQFNHFLIVFGGLYGIEAALDAAPEIRIKNVKQLFDYYLNTCPGQGSRTIRTEEAMLISLTALRNFLPF